MSVSGGAFAEQKTLLLPQKKIIVAWHCQSLPAIFVYLCWVYNIPIEILINIMIEKMIMRLKSNVLLKIPTLHKNNMATILLIVPEKAMVEDSIFVGAFL